MVIWIKRQKDPTRFNFFPIFIPVWYYCHAYFQIIRVACSFLNNSWTYQVRNEKFGGEFSAEIIPNYTILYLARVISFLVPEPIFSLTLSLSHSLLILSPPFSPSLFLAFYLSFCFSFSFSSSVFFSFPFSVFFSLSLSHSPILISLCPSLPPSLVMVYDLSLSLWYLALVNIVTKTSGLVYFQCARSHICVMLSDPTRSEKYYFIYI